MAYTLEQLTKAWTAVHDGIVPDATTTADLQTYINLAASGQITDAQALGFVINSGDSTTALAALSYQFFTGKAPTKAGLDYLVNSPSNPSDLNDPYYAKFNIENRYINFAANLGVQGEGAAGFAAKYGAMSFSDYIASIYETIIGGSFAKAAGVDAAKAIADIASRQSAILATAQASGMITPGMTAAQIDLVVKAAAAGYLLGEAIKADVGIYAGAANGFMLALATDSPVYGVDITKTYAPSPGAAGAGPVVGTPPVLPGGPATAPDPVAHSFVLTAQADALTGESLNDTFTATSATFNANDVLDGGAGSDTLTLTAATGGIYVLPGATVTGVETVNLSNDHSLDIDTRSWTGLTKLNLTFAGQIDAGVATTTDIVVNNTNQRGGDVQMSGGHDVTINVSQAVGGSISIDGMTGAVVINQQNATAGVSDIWVTGGASVSVTQTAAPSITPSDAKVHVQGSALTASVTTRGASGANNTAVEIRDVNDGSTTAVGKITSIDADRYGGSLNIYDNNLSTLKLAHSQAGVGIFNSGLTTPAATTLNLTVNGLGSGAFISDQAVYTTLNITTGAEASTLGVNMTHLTAINVSGASLFTTNYSGGSLLTLGVTGAGGFTDTNLGNASGLTALNAGTATGAITVSAKADVTAITTGSGADSVELWSSTITKAIALGGGNDTLTLATGTRSSAATVDGGAGTADVLKMDALDAAAASFSSTFATKVIGFERLVLTGASNQTIDLAQLGNYHHVTASGGDGLTLIDMTSGDTLVLNGAAGTNGYVLGGNFPFFTDLLNISLVDTAGAQLQFGKINAPSVELVRMTVTDGAPAAGHVEQVTWLGNDLVNLTLTGNAGVALTAASTSINTLDASGLTGAFSWTSSALAGLVVLKGSATGNNTIDLSASTHGTEYTGGSGNDDVTLRNGSANGIVDLGDGTNTVHASGITGFNIKGGSGADTIYVDSLQGTIDLGTGLDTIIFTGSNQYSSAWTAITGVGAGDKIQFNFAPGVTSFGAATDISGYSDIYTAIVNELVGDGSTTPIVKWFVSGGDAYIMIDRSAGYFSASDYVIKLVGVTDLSHAAISGTTITF